MLKLVKKNLCYYKDFKRIDGKNPRMSGDCSKLRGDCSKLSGDCSKLSGDCTDLEGDLDTITQEMRAKDSNIRSYIYKLCK